MDSDALIAFLNARLADDVAAVDGYVDAELDELRIANAGTATREEIMEFRADLRRALAEVEAKRRLIAEYEHQLVKSDENASKFVALTRSASLDQQEFTNVKTHGWELSGRIQALGFAVRALSLPYLGHPDYREEWRP